MPDGKGSPASGNDPDGGPIKPSTISATPTFYPFPTETEIGPTPPGVHPPGKGPLRLAIEDFILTFKPTLWIHNYSIGVHARYVETAEMWGKVKQQQWWLAIWLGIPMAAGAVIYWLTGVKAGLIYLELASVEDPVAEAAKDYEQIWTNVWEKGRIDRYIDLLGEVISEPILSLFEHVTPEEVEDPRALVRRFHGLLMGLTLAPGAITSSMEAAGLGQIEEPGRVVQSLYWNFGLGFLGWQTLAPLLDAGMRKRLEEHYQEVFRPTRFATSELRDLLALGEIGQEAMRDEARRLGWREQDINKWIKLAFRNISESDLWTLWHAKALKPDEMVSRLRALGYDPNDIPWLFLAHRSDTLNETAEITLSTARKAFDQYLISEEAFRSALKALDKSEAEIDLIVQLEKNRREHDRRSLTISQIKQAWSENVLTDAEATHWLKLAGSGDEEIDILLQTWREQAEPEFRKLNTGTIVSAYVNAVLTRDQAFYKLKSVGLAPEDATLTLDLAEARSPEAFGAPQARPPRALSPGTLSDLVGSGLISAADMQARLQEQGYTSANAALLARAAAIKAEEEPRPLTQSTIERAYASGVLTRGLAKQRLAELGFSDEDARAILDTVEAENPWVFAPESVQSVRVPSVSALVEAVRNGIIDESDYYARMSEMGYRRDGAEMYLALALRGGAKKVKTLTPSQIAEAYDRDFFDLTQAKMRLVQQGYTEDDAAIILRFKKSGIEYLEVWKDMLAGLISVEDTVNQLFSMGFTQDEVEEAFKQLEAESGS